MIFINYVFIEIIILKLIQCCILIFQLAIESLLCSLPRGGGGEVVDTRNGWLMEIMCCYYLSFKCRKLFWLGLDIHPIFRKQDFGFVAVMAQRVPT